ncbi:MAG TPA: hypothetical protein VFA11_03050 [Acidimicrobiales bacterium]|nr:hypothetical protein [Acidimicrobiales bacterium]
MRSRGVLALERPRHQRVLNPKDDSTKADSRLTIIVFSVVALLGALDFATVRSGNQLVLAAVVVGYSFWRAGQGWVRFMRFSTA